MTFVKHLWPHGGEVLHHLGVSGLIEIRYLLTKVRCKAAHPKLLDFGFFKVNFHANVFVLVLALHAFGSCIAKRRRVESQNGGGTISVSTSCL